MLYLPVFPALKRRHFSNIFDNFHKTRGCTLTNTVTSHMPTAYMDNIFLQSAVETQIDEGFNMEPFSRAFGALLGKQLV